MLNSEDNITIFPGIEQALIDTKATETNLPRVAHAIQLAYGGAGLNRYGEWTKKNGIDDISIILESWETADAASIPESLKATNQFIGWRLGPARSNGKAAKLPVDPKTGRRTDITNPQGCRTFQEALAGMIRYELSGIGIVLTQEAGIVAVDIDDCRDKKTGTITPFASEILSKLNSFTEISQSGEGLHVFVRASPPRGGCRRGALEMYGTARFIALTGRHLPGTPTAVDHRQAEIEEIHRLYIAKPKSDFTDSPGKGVDKPNVTGASLPDDQVVGMALSSKNGETFKRLLAGDFEGFESPSEATLALLNMLAFWTGKDSEQMDRLFRASGLMREKWDGMRGSETWGEQQVAKAIQDTKDIWSPSRDFMGEGNEGDWPLSDLGNAQRFINQHGADARYCPPWKKWLYWTGQRWKTDTDGTIERLVKATVLTLYDEAKSASDLRESDRLARFAVRSQSRAGIENSLRLAQTEQGVALQPNEMDGNLWLLQVGNGTLDLRTGQLSKPQRENFITKSIDVDFDPDAQCPIWERFLDHALAGNVELIRFLQRAVGYSLTGAIREHAIFYVFGSGRNGKSTFFETLTSLFGDYGARLPSESLMVKPNGGGISNDIASLFGSRITISSEIREGARLNETLVKELSGGDMIKVRRLYQDFFEFRPTFKMWIGGNYKPIILGQDLGIWRRINLIPFSNTIAEAEVDLRLGEKLLGELPGVLAWAVKGCLDWQSTGLRPPKAVAEATDAYRTDSDLMGFFIDECCVIGQDKRVTSSELYATYKAWSQDSGTHSLPQISFGRKLSDRGFKSQHISTGGQWLGLSLKGQNDGNDGSPPISDNFSMRTDLENVSEKGVYPSRPSSGGISYIQERANRQAIIDFNTPVGIRDESIIDRAIRGFKPTANLSGMPGAGA